MKFFEKAVTLFENAIHGNEKLTNLYHIIVAIALMVCSINGEVIQKILLYSMVSRIVGSVMSEGIFDRKK